MLLSLFSFSPGILSSSGEADNGEADDVESGQGGKNPRNFGYSSSRSRYKDMYSGTLTQ